MDKRIIFNHEARVGVAKGIDIVANAVKVTLGYGGRTVIVSDGALPTRTTKDGVTVASNIFLKDDILNAGAKMVKEVSSKTADDTGDGTTSVCILMQEIVNEGLALIQTGANPMMLKRGIDSAVSSIVATLDRMKIDVGENNELLKQVATVAANNDNSIGGIVGKIFENLGPYGIVAIEDSKTYDTYIESVNGFQFQSGWISPYFMTDHGKNICELENPYVLIVDGKLQKFTHIVNIVNKVVAQRRSLLIIADDFDSEVIANLLKNKGVLPSSCVKYNFIGETKEELMLDLCAMTGATLITEKKGMLIEKIDLILLGECEKIVSTRDETTIVSGKQSEELVKSRIEDAKVKIADAKHPFIKQLQEKRAAKLSGGIAICYVGGHTEVERSEKKDRIDDSVRATKAAIEEGIVAGGGTALLNCIPNLNALTYESEDEKRGIHLIIKAIKKPAFQISENAFGEGQGAVNLRLLEGKPVGIGYNAKTGNQEDLVKSGIIDPKKVVRICIENAASAAAQVLISEALIVNDIQTS